MLQIQKIRSDKDFIIKKILEIRNINVADQINKIYDLDLQKRETQKILDEFSSKMNVLSSQIGTEFKAGNIDKANDLKKQTTTLKDKIKLLVFWRVVFKSNRSCLLRHSPNFKIP